MLKELDVEPNRHGNIKGSTGGPDAYTTPPSPASSPLATCATANLW